jgi:hypothetical protein
MKLVIYQVYDHVADGAVPHPADPEWFAIDMIVKSGHYDIISPEQTSHNESIIASIMHAMLAKIRCGITINKERDKSDIII